MTKHATMETSKGTIKLELFDGDCPKVVANFVKLAEEKYYDGLKFHRVINDFMVQGGCPKGTGTGGPGWSVDCEIVPSRKHGQGSLSMAHSGQCSHDPETGEKQGGECTNGSQFFITHVPTPHLDGVHTVFGQVTEGQDVVDQITQGDEMTTVMISGD